MILGRCEWQRCMGSLGRKLQNRTEGGGERGGRWEFGWGKSERQEVQKNAGG